MTERKAKAEAISTRVYMENAMQKVFRRNTAEHLQKLLQGDRDTLEHCSEFLAKNLNHFQLLHTLCLLTGTKFDLDEKDHAKAADAWICWWQEHKDKLAWDAAEERWAIPK